jgi:hypothetical protein
MVSTQLERLTKLVADKVIDTDDFYIVEFDKHRICLQGDLSARKLHKYKELANITFDEECGWFKGYKDGIRIVLTLN